MCGGVVGLGYPGLQFLLDPRVDGHEIHFIHNGVNIAKIVNIGQMIDIMTEIERRERINEELG